MPRSAQGLILDLETKFVLIIRLRIDRNATWRYKAQEKKRPNCTNYYKMIDTRIMYGLRSEYHLEVKANNPIIKKYELGFR